MRVHVEDARRALGPLGVAADPVQRLGDRGSAHAARPGRRAVSCCCCCCCCAAACWPTGGPGSGGCRVSRGGAAAGDVRFVDDDGVVEPGREHPRVLRATALARVHDQAALRERDPRQPARARPTRLRRRAARTDAGRGAAAPIAPSTYVGAVDSATGNCAIHAADRRDTRRASARELLVARRAARSRGRTRPIRRPASTRAGRAGRAPTRARRRRRGRRSRRCRGSASRRGSTRSSRARTGRSPCRRRRRCRRSWRS